MRSLSLILLLFLLWSSCRAPKSKTVDPWLDYRKAYNFLNKDIDSAFFYFNRSASNASDKVQVALAYYNMALIQSNAGDDYGAQESLTNSLKHLDENKKEHRGYLASDYNQLGMTFYNLGENREAITYYQMALKYADDVKLRPYILNNEGNSFQALKVYDKTIGCYKAVLGSVDKTGIVYARALTNLANTRWMQDHHYNAVPELLESLAIRLRQKDVWGENSSYAHLADFYTVSKPDSARWYAQKMLYTATRLRSPDDQQQALKKLILLSPAEQSRAYFKQYQARADSLQTKRNVAKNQFALIRYNVERAKADNIQLQKINTERNYQLVVVALFTLAAAFIGFYLYKRRRRRLLLESDRRLQESKLRLSQKVHDKVANGIYSIMSEVEHLPQLDRTVLLDKLENMYNVSRNVAHDEAESAVDFAERISAMINAFKSDLIKIGVEGNKTELWQTVRSETREELLLVIQELMVNMSKHSHATKAYVGFSADNGRLLFEYRDDGIGFVGTAAAGYGIESTVSRIQALNGTINFEGVGTKGLHVWIQLPIY